MATVTVKIGSDTVSASYSTVPLVPYTAFANATDELQIGLQSKANAYLAAHPELGGTMRVKLDAGFYWIRGFNTADYGVINDNIVGLHTAGIDKTFIGMIPNSSTSASKVPNQMTQAGQSVPMSMMRLGGKKKVLFTGGFTMFGTDQGHIYNGLSMYAWAAGSYIEAIKITGVPGNWNSPPGECFQGNSWNCVNLRIGYIEVDGYQYTWTKNASGVYVSTRSANPVGGSPFGGNGSNGIQIDKAYLHDAFVSGPTFYRCSNVVTNSLESTRNANWSSGDGRDFPGINHEQNSGTFVHNNPVTNVQGSAAHVYAAGITGSIKLTINNPSWSGGDSRGKGAYIVVIPNKYAGGNSSQLVSDVVVNDANGKPMNYFDAGVAWANPVPANIDKSKTFVLVR